MGHACESHVREGRAIRSCPHYGCSVPSMAMERFGFSDAVGSKLYEVGGWGVCNKECIPALLVAFWLRV